MTLKLKEIIKKIYLSRWFILFIILTGIAIRLRQYIFCRSLWIDESLLALNIIKYNYLDLLKPLDNSQVAPPLFLLITDFFTKFFGYSEYVLRILPLVAGCASLFLFWYLANKFLHKFLVPIAVGFLAFSRYAIYYSNEFKQYSVELMVTIIILILGLRVYTKNFNIKSNLLLGFLGALMIWLSHTSVFILAGVSVSLVLIVFITERLKDKKKYFNIILMSAIWFISFLLYYLLILKYFVPPNLFEIWQDSFAPIITSINDLLWYPSTMLKLIKDPLYIYFPGIVMLMILAAFMGLYRKKEKLFFFFILFPLLITLIASLFKIYPIYGRLILFTLPIFYLLIAKGLEEFFFNITRKNITITLFLIFLLFSQPLYYSFPGLFLPKFNEETRPLIEYYQKHKSNEDKIYVYYLAKNPFLYYTRDNNEEFIEGIESPRDPSKYLTELESLDGEGRIWFLFSHRREYEINIFIEKLDNLGQLLTHVKTEGASLYLYDI